ncbi:hypothetical protein SC171_23355 [Pantoea cypripedii]|uniref:hypothetical protein n=1 Tax=Pantoea cypripedii TaxID=55209 RepID=UPI002FCC669C
MSDKNISSTLTPLFLGIMMSAGLGSVAIAGPAEQANAIEFPADVVYMQEKPDGSMFVGYESVDKDNCSDTRCFSYGIINSDNSVKLAKNWLMGSFVYQYQANEKNTTLMDKNGDIYLSLFPTREILKISDPENTPQIVFEAPAIVNKSGDVRSANVVRVHDFIFNDDFSHMYVRMQVESPMEMGMAAVDLRKSDHPVIWHDSRTKTNSVLFNPNSNELVYQGLNNLAAEPLVAYMMSATTGEYSKNGGPLFTGLQSVQAKEGVGNVAYGLDYADCKVTKMMLADGKIGEEIWTNEVPGCKVNINNGEKRTIALNSFDKFLYAGYENIITIFDKENGNRVIDVFPPVGKFYGDIKFNSNTQKAYRLFSDGVEYGVLEFSHEGKTKVYPAAEKTGDFVTFGSHLYMGESNKVVKYNLDVKEI